MGLRDSADSPLTLGANPANSPGVPQNWQGAHLLHLTITTTITTTTMVTLKDMQVLLTCSQAEVLNGNPDQTPREFQRMQIKPVI